MPGTESKELAQQAYEAYGDHAHWLTFDGRPMPKWNDLTAAVRLHWLAATISIVASTRDLALDHRERLQIEHAQNYTANFAEAGAVGHTAYLLIAKLSQALGL